MRIKKNVILVAVGILAVVIVVARGQNSSRYRELKTIVNNNAGSAHGTRGMNMYTLVALRGCVTEKDIPILAEMLDDKDRVTRMTSAHVLADLGKQGMTILSKRLEKATDSSDRLMLQETLTEAVGPTYRPILQYPLTERERTQIRGCSEKSH